MTQPRLAQIEAAFAAEFPVQALPSSEDAPLGQLVIGLDTDGQGRDRAVSLLLVPPINDEDLYGLQFFAPLPFQISGEDFGVLARLLLLINSAVPLIGFGLSEENHLVYFRCILPVVQGAVLDPSVALHTAWLLYSCLDRFSDTIEAVATGRMSYTEANSAVQVVLASLGEE